MSECIQWLKSQKTEEEAMRLLGKMDALETAIRTNADLLELDIDELRFVLATIVAKLAVHGSLVRFGYFSEDGGCETDEQVLWLQRHRLAVRNYTEALASELFCTLRTSTDQEFRIRFGQSKD